MALRMPKRLPSITTILEDASAGAREHGSTKYWPPWRIDFIPAGRILRAHLYAADFKIVSLDHHARGVSKPGRLDYTAPGYHWDERPPLAPERRVWLDPQPTDVFAAMRRLAKAWNIVYEADLLLLNEDSP